MNEFFYVTPDNFENDLAQEISRTIEKYPQFEYIQASSHYILNRGFGVLKIAFSHQEDFDEEDSNQCFLLAKPYFVLCLN